jgi:hypothetical protein
VRRERSTVSQRLLAAWLIGALSSGCYSKRTNGIRDEPHITRTEVQNGYRATAEASSDAQAVHVHLEQAPLCRPADMGEVRHYETYVWWKDDATIYLGVGFGTAGLLVGGAGALISANQPNGSFKFNGTSDALASVAVGGLVILATALFLPQYFNSSDETPRESTPVARWTGPRGDCAVRWVAPIEGADVRLDAKFGGAPDGLYWTGKSGPNGVDFGLVPQLGALSRSCGQADVKVSVAQQGGVDYSDTPDAPWTGTQMPEPLSVSDAVARGISAPGAPQLPTATLQGASRDTAMRCEANRKAACLSRMPVQMTQALERSCTEQCGRAVDAMGPVYMRRDCEAQAQDDGDRQVCVEGFSQALGELGVDLADFSACVGQCVEAGRQRQCP